MKRKNIKTLHVSPYLLLGLTVLFWAGNFVLSRGIHLSAPPMALSFWRWATALVFLMPFASGQLWKQRKEIVRAWKILTLLGIVGVAGFSVFLYLGLQTTTATNGVLLNTVSPVLIILISWLFLRQRLAWRQSLGVAMAFMGVLVIVTGGNLRILLSLSFNTGDLWVLAGVACWAVYTVCLRFKPKGLTGLAFLEALVCIAVIAIMPLYLWELSSGKSIQPTPAIVAGILYLGLFPSLLSYIFWNRAVAEAGATKAGLFIYLMPVFGMLLSVIFLKESLQVFHFTGMILVFAGIYFTTTIKAGK